MRPSLPSYLTMRALDCEPEMAVPPTTTSPAESTAMERASLSRSQRLRRQRMAPFAPEIFAVKRHRRAPFGSVAATSTLPLASSAAIGASSRVPVAAVTVTCHWVAGQAALAADGTRSAASVASSVPTLTRMGSHIRLDRLGIGLHHLESLRQLLDSLECGRPRRVLAESLHDRLIELHRQGSLQADHGDARLAQAQRDLHAVGGVRIDH